MGYAEFIGFVNPHGIFFHLTSGEIQVYDWIITVQLWGNGLVIFVYMKGSHNQSDNAKIMHFCDESGKVLA